MRAGDEDPRVHHDLGLFTVGERPGPPRHVRAAPARPAVGTIDELGEARARRARRGGVVTA